MRGIKLVPLYFGSLSAIAFALAAPIATAQELHGHKVCRDIDAFTPEQLGDREGHALAIGQTSCQITEGPFTGAVLTETSMLEWDGPKAKELSGYGVARKPGATFAFQHTDGTLEVTMTDGKPSGWTASGHAIATLATGSWASSIGKKDEWTGRAQVRMSLRPTRRTSDTLRRWEDPWRRGARAAVAATRLQPPLRVEAGPTSR